MKYFIVVISLLICQIMFSVPDKLAKYLNLSDDQILKIDKIVQDDEAKKTDLRLKLQIKQLELRQILLENEINLDIVKYNLEEIAKIETELRFSILLQGINISKVLTQDQRSKYKTIRAQMKSFNDMPMMRGNIGPCPDMR